MSSTNDSSYMSFLVRGRGWVLLFALALPAFAGPSVPGIRNFYQVNQLVYRGAQPTDEGLKYLAKIGVKTVIDLREAGERSDAEQAAVTADGMRFINIPMTGKTPPTEAEIGRILNILEAGNPGGVFVHCKRGADRTGAVIASYRIDHDGWDNSRALHEAMDRGMSHSQFPRQNYIRAFKPRGITGKADTEQGSAPPVSGASAAPVGAVTITQ